VRKLTTWFLWPDGVKRSDIQRRLLQFAERMQLHLALCSTVYGASSVARNAQWVLLLNRLIMVQWTQMQAPKEMAAMCNLRTGICWASSCLVLSLKIITLLQMRWVQTTSRLSYCSIPHFSAFIKSNLFSNFCRQEL